jgi:hypothetical protein
MYISLLVSQDTTLQLVICSHPHASEQVPVNVGYVLGNLHPY